MSTTTNRSASTTNNIDFHLTITRVAQGDGYTARVIDSPVGQATVDFTLPFSHDAVRQLSWRAGFSPRDVKLIKAPTPSSTTLDTPTLTMEEFGKRLFDAVFAGAVGQLFARSLDAAEREKCNLRIQLQFDAVPEVAELPWEYLYSRDLDRYLALSTRTPLVRYMALAQAERSLAVTLPLRVLVVVASPSDVPRLDVEAEWTHLNAGVRELVEKGVVEIERMEKGTLATLRQQLRRGQFHILHFIGHGDFDAATDEGSLIFEDDAGKQDAVSAKQLATLLHDHATLRLVFLNACQGATGSRENAFAGVAQRLVQQGVPTVLAMQFAVSDRTAIALAHEFYASLSDGLPLESAVAEARKAIYSEGIDFEWGTPVLFTRSPDGVLVALPTPEAVEDSTNGNRQSSSFGQLREVHAGGDVVIGNVTGDDADSAGDGSKNRGTRNVIVGKNNVQINIGGQLMTLPFWLISIALLVVVGILSAPAIEPIFWPSQMSGGMNIAIANFGQIDASGDVKTSALGATLSKSVFDKLNQEYQEVYPELLGTDARSVEIWHDSLGRDVKNLNFGILAGETPEERAQHAEELAARINADIVIYGYLIEEGNQNSLHLDFYYAGDTLRGEPDTVVGRHVLSELISFPTSLAQEPMAVQEVLNVPLGLRARVLFWVTVALIFDVTDQQERALATLQEAEATLTDLDDNDGQALLHYFIGREAFWLREYDVAIAALEEAQGFKSNYANVYIALGAVHYDRAQLFYTPQPIPAGLEECISTEHLDRAAQSAEESMREIDLAIGYLEEAVAVAPDSPWPPIEFPARLALGHAYRLKGQAYLLGAEPELGQAWFTKSLVEFDLAQEAFAESKQQQYLAWTHLGRAATYQLQAYTTLVGIQPDDEPTTVTQKHEAAATLFLQADEECQNCLDEGKDVADLVYQKKVLRCGCEYLQGLAQAAGVELQKLMEEP